MQLFKHRVFPIIDTVQSYKQSYLRRDVVAGLMVTIMLIPQAMAYAMLAGVPPEYGLYAGIVPVLVYAIFGTSPHIAVGPVAITSILLYDGLSNIAVPFSADYVRLMIVAGFLIGFIQILFGLLRLGVLVNLLSLPVLTGFTSAASLLIIASQLSDLLGINIPRYDYLHQQLWYAISHLREIQMDTFLIGIASLIFIIFVKHWRRGFPAGLVLVIVGTAASYFFDLPSRGVEVVGEISASLPTFEAPELTFRQLRKSFSIILAVTLIGLIETIGIGKAIEQQHDYYSIKPNKEFIAIGISKVLGGLFQSIPTSTSYSRSAILNNAGGRTVLAGAFSAIFLVLSVLLFIEHIKFLPKVILAAIILMAVKSLFDIATARYLYKVHKRDFFMLMVTFLVTLLLSMDAGVITGVVLSFVLVLIKSSRPRISELGQVRGETYYRSLLHDDDVDIVDGVMIIRYDDQIYFANQQYCHTVTFEMIDQCDRPLHTVILDLRGVQDIDSSGLRFMRQLYGDLQDKGIHLMIGGAIAPVRKSMAEAGIRRLIGQNNFYPSIHRAVQALPSQLADQLDR